MLCVLLNVSAQLLLKSGATNYGDTLSRDSLALRTWVQVLASPWILGGILLWTLSTLLWIYLISQVDLSYAIALYSLNYLVTPIAARFLFQESVNTLQIAGLAFIALGVGMTVSSKIGET